jgi:hypothetical protein
MRTDKLSLWSAVAALGLLAGLTCEKQAVADDLNLGGTFNAGNFYTFNGSSPGGGGSITPSFLNGVSLPYVYCIDIPDNVNVPVDYKFSTVTTNGTAIYGNPTENPWSTGGLVSVPQAQGVANLLGTYAAAANVGTAAQQALLQDGLQAALWATIYGYGTSTTGLFVTDSSVLAQMNSDLAGANYHAVSSVYWLSPGDGSSTIYQALVTANNGASPDPIGSPEPSTMVIAGLSALGFLGYGWKRRKRS